MSETDIHAGDRWLSELSRQLDETTFGIVVLTPDNMEAPWINFESGALAKKLGEGAVCPYLLDISEASQVVGPLGQFQSKKATKSDTLVLLKDINQAMGDRRLAESTLNETFERWWSDLEKAIAQAPASQRKIQKRTDRDLIEETLERVRSLGRAPSPTDMAALAYEVRDVIYPNLRLLELLKPLDRSQLRSLLDHLELLVTPKPEPEDNGQKK